MGEKFIRYANSFQTVISLRLERISALLDLMGNPQRGQRFIHVAGTNGKGSVCAFLEAILSESGFKVGKFISPNLIRVNERITVNGEEISDSELNPLLEKIGDLCVEAEKRTGEFPSQFEVWTAAAMEYFKNKRCDYVLLEVGLGGTYDATNVIESNEMAVITRIALDHCAMLGSSEEEIARAKCGIIKENSLTVALRQNEGVNSVIARRAREKNNRLCFAEIPESIGHDVLYERFCCKGMDNLVCGLGGLHQLENAAVAVEAAIALGIGEKAIRAGLASAKNPARLEMIAENLIFDGAHNPNGVGALVKNLDCYFPETAQTVIFACMKDKDIVSSLRLLNSPERRFIFTCVKGNSRSMSPEELCRLAAENGIDGEIAPNLTAAVRLAKGIGRMTIICGSLYLYETMPEAVKAWNG